MPFNIYFLTPLQQYLVIVKILKHSFYCLHESLKHLRAIKDNSLRHLLHILKGTSIYSIVSLAHFRHNSWLNILIDDTLCNEPFCFWLLFPFTLLCAFCCFISCFIFYLNSCVLVKISVSPHYFRFLFCWKIVKNGEVNLCKRISN